MLSEEQQFVLSLLRDSMGKGAGIRVPDSFGSASRMILQNGILLTVFPSVKRIAAEKQTDGDFQ